ncbi:MAG: ATP-dependent helicase [Pyrinomonadaceae bacterium]
MSNQEHFDEVLGSAAKRICVIAGPGSGKTKGIIIPKAKALIEAEVEGSAILLLSFSRMSAADLKNRVKALDKIPIASTVHAFCLSYLLRENDHAIRDRIDSIAIDFELDFLVNDLKLLFPKENRRDLSKALKAFSAGWAVLPHDQVFEEDDFRRRFKGAVVNWLAEHKAVMMDEIVYFALDHLRKVGKPEYLNPIRYIFVDEYQDLNRLEQEFIETIADGADLFLTAGDPDQSIYSFKFAHRSGIVDFFERADVHGISLPYCGRCAVNILNVANQLLVQEKPDRVDLPLPLPDKPDGEVFLLKPFDSQEKEFCFVFEAIRTQIEKGSSPSDTLVLVPKYKLGKDFVDYTNERATELPEGVNFKLVNTPKFSSAQQEQILLLALTVNPGSIIHSRSFIGLPDAKGFAGELAQLKNHYGGWESLLKNATPDDFSKKNKRLRQTCERIVSLRESLPHLSQLSVVEIIDSLFPADNVEFADINALLKELATDQDSISDAFLKFLDKIRTIPEDEQTVRVMTIMASKGLESPNVFILGCNAGNVPGTNRSDTLSDHEHNQEQRRLLYVGFTRAQSSLTVTWSQNIPWAESKGQATPGVRTLKINGKVVARVGICPFIQDLA